MRERGKKRRERSEEGEKMKRRRGRVKLEGEEKIEQKRGKWREKNSGERVR